MDYKYKDKKNPWTSINYSLGFFANTFITFYSLLLYNLDTSGKH